MAITLHVNGPAELTYGGSAMGWADPTGCTITIKNYTEDAKSDLWGPYVPGSPIQLGAEAIVTATMAYYDAVILGIALANSQASTSFGTYGTAGSIGTLLGGPAGTLAGFLKQLIVTSPIDLAAYTFGASGGGVYIQEDATFNAAATQKFYNVVFRCLPNASGQIFTTTTLNQA